VPIRAASLNPQIEHTVGRISWPERNKAFWIGVTAQRSSQLQPLYEVSHGRRGRSIMMVAETPLDLIERMIKRSHFHAKLAHKNSLEVASVVCPLTFDR
jgi:hypothetical protein